MSILYHEGLVSDLPVGTERLDSRGDKWHLVLTIRDRRSGYLGRGYPPSVAREHIRAAARSSPGSTILVLWEPDSEGDIQLGLLRGPYDGLSQIGVLEPPEWLQRLEEENKNKISTFWSRLGGVDIPEDV